MTLNAVLVMERPLDNVRREERYDLEHMDKVLGRVDQQYRTEMRGRGRGRSHPGFNNMPDAQQLTVLQRLRVALGKGDE